MLPSAFPPQSFLATQAFIDRYRLQLIHDARARLHHAMAMPEQLPQIAIFPVGHPDLGKVILQHELQNMLRVLAIGLLLAYPLGLDLGRVAHPQLESSAKSRSNQRPCPLASVPTRPFIPYALVPGGWQVMPCGT